MRVMVEVRFGPLSGKRKVLEPGDSIRIGRHPHADIYVEQDRDMSVHHFELAWDGAVCRLSDSRSMKGTLVNGERLREAQVPHGSWIKAGNTNFMVYFEEHTPPRFDADLTITPAKQQALAILEAEPQPLFAVLDAGRSDRVLELLRESPNEYRSLFEGTKGDAMAETAPHLVALPKGTRLLRHLVVEGWGKRWGIYLTSKWSFRSVRQHLRRFLMLREGETLKQMYFRFYDPGAFRVVWSTCSGRQKAEFMKDLSSILHEGPDGGVTRILAEPTGGGAGWTIRKPQMKAIGKAMAFERFENDMISLLREFSPQSARIIGERGIREVVRLAIERGHLYGLTNPGHLQFYVELMFMFGSFFDTDPLFFWASEVLRDPTIEDPEARMVRLHKTMLQYCNEISGPDREFDDQALRNSDQAFVSGYSSADPMFESKLVGAFFSIHSRRALYLGDDRLRGLVHAAADEAHRLALNTTNGISLVAFLMFTKGHGFARDPLLPWVPRTLGDALGEDLGSRAARLEQGFYCYREQVLAPLD